MVHLFGFRSFESKDPQKKTTHKFVCALKDDVCIHQTSEKTGKPCTKNAVRGTPLCPQHLMTEYQLKIAVSHLPGAGKGLFAFRDGGKPGELVFNDDERIIEYIGERIDSATLEKRYVGKMAPFVIQIADTDEYIDGACERGAASFANHSVDQANAEFQWDDDKEAKTIRVYLHATKPIYQCDEILVDYGKKYGDPSEQQGLCFYTKRFKVNPPDLSDFVKTKHDQWKFCEDGQSGGDEESGNHPCPEQQRQKILPQKPKLVFEGKKPRIYPAKAPEIHVVHVPAAPLSPLRTTEQEAFRIPSFPILSPQTPLPNLYPSFSREASPFTFPTFSEASSPLTPLPLTPLTPLPLPLPLSINRRLKFMEGAEEGDSHRAIEAEEREIAQTAQDAAEALDEEEADHRKVAQSARDEEAEEGRKEEAEEGREEEAEEGRGEEAEEVEEEGREEEEEEEEEEALEKADKGADFVKFNVKITRDLTSCLLDTRDLNNNVVNFYLRYLTKDRNDIFVAPSLFLKSLRNDNATRYFTGKLEGLKAIVIPSVHDKWWDLIYVNLESKKIYILRNGKNLPKDNTFKIVVEWLEKLNAATKWVVNPMTLNNVKTHEDSGVYACMFAEMQIFSQIFSDDVEAEAAATETDPLKYRKQMYTNIWNERFVFSFMLEWTSLERSLIKANLLHEFPDTEGEDLVEFDARVSMAAWTVDGQYAGMVLCSGKQSVLSIDYLTTAPHNRRQGLGKKLLAKAEARAKVLDYTTAELQVDVKSPELKWYESLGYKAANHPMMVMRVPMQKMVKVLRRSVDKP